VLSEYRSGIAAQPTKTTARRSSFSVGCRRLGDVGGAPRPSSVALRRTIASAAPRYLMQINANAWLQKF